MREVALTLLCAGLLTANGSAKGPENPSASSIFHADSNHLWNRLHRSLFVRTDKNGNEHGVDSVDPYLWPETSEFLLKGKSYEDAISCLNEFIKFKGEKLLNDPLKRAVLQHDLWAVFDWTANFNKALPFGGRTGNKVLTDPALINARMALRQKLSEAIARLALDNQEITALPNNYSLALNSKSFASAYSEDLSDQPFLPNELFSQKGSWICIRGALNGPSAPVHMKYYRGRSPFLVFISLPGGRQVTVNYLNLLNQRSAASSNIEDWEKGLPLFPVGTAVALVRKMTAINRSGEIVVTPLVQTVQFRVYRKTGEEIKDHRSSQAVFKFTLNRNDLFAGKNGGLRPVPRGDRSGLSLIYSSDYFEAGDSAPKVTVMQSCVDCHSCGGATVKSIFSFKQDDWVPEAASINRNRLRLLQTSIQREEQRAVVWKYQRHDWGLLQGWMETYSFNQSASAPSG